MTGMGRVAALGMLAGCAAATTPRGTYRATESYGGDDGSSCAKRVIIHARSEQAGADAETQWLLSNYPGHQRGIQKLATCDEHPVDVIRIHTAEGQSIDVYFDIFEYYGHF